MYFITDFVKEDLKILGVLADNKVIRKIYEFFLQHGFKVTIESLKNKNPCYYIDIPDTCDDEGYDKLMLNSEAFKTLDYKSNDGVFPKIRDVPENWGKIVKKNAC